MKNFTSRRCPLFTKSWLEGDNHSGLLNTRGGAAWLWDLVTYPAGLLPGRITLLKMPHVLRVALLSIRALCSGLSLSKCLEAWRAREKEHPLSPGLVKKAAKLHGRERKLFLSIKIMANVQNFHKFRMICGASFLLNE